MTIAIGIKRDPFSNRQDGLHLHAVGHGYWPTIPMDEAREKYGVTQILEFKDQRGTSYMIGFLGDSPAYGQITHERPFQPIELPLPDMTISF